MNIDAIVQARQGSTRLPGKGLVDLNGMSAIGRVVSRLKESKHIGRVIVATTENPEDDALAAEAVRHGASVFRGSQDDVLKRVLDAAMAFHTDIIVEITADCPLMDWDVVDRVVATYLDAIKTGVPCDMAVNFIPKTYPKGYEVRVFPFDTLHRIDHEVDNPIDRQHVTTWAFWNPMGRRGYKILNVEANRTETRPDLAITLDTVEDLALIRTLFAMGHEYTLPLSVQDVINLIDIYPHIYGDVREVPRKDYMDEITRWYRANTIKLSTGKVIRRSERKTERGVPKAETAKAKAAKARAEKAKGGKK